MYIKPFSKCKDKKKMLRILSHLAREMDYYDDLCNYESLKSDGYSSDNEIYILIDDKKVIGFACVSFGGCPMITNILIHRNYRGSTEGYSEHLMEYILEVVVSEDEKVLLQVDYRNVRAIKYYLNHGFLVTGLLPDEYDDEHTALFMTYRKQGYYIDEFME